MKNLGDIFVDEYDKSLWGEGPFPFSLESPQETARIYTGGRMIVLVTTNLDFAGSLKHAHSSYEFTFTHTSAVPCHVGHKKNVMEKSRVFPFNPEQEHGPTEQMKGLSMSGIMVDKDFLQEISRSMYGKAEVNFYNQNFRYSNDIQTVINTFIQEAQNRQPGYKFILESLAIQIVVDFLRHLRSNMPISVTEQKKKTSTGRSTI